MMKKCQKMLSMILTMVMLLVLMPTTALALAETDVEDLLPVEAVVKTIMAIDDLDSSIANQRLEEGNSESALVLPTTLDVTYYIGTDNSITENVTLGVTWASDKEFSSEIGIITYFPTITDSGYIVEHVSLPTIIVEIVETVEHTTLEDKGAEPPIFGFGWTRNGTKLTIDDNEGFSNWKRDNANSVNKISITEAIITEKVTVIDAAAFTGFQELTSVTLPNSINKIEDYAFYDCRSLTTITIPSNVSSIGNAAFYDCRGLNTLTFNGTSLLRSIGSEAFYNCVALPTIKIPNGLESIGNSAFQQCTLLNNITIPASVETIGTGTFKDCTTLDDVTFRNAITKIPDSTFSGCISLASFTFPETVVSIGSDAFRSCNISDSFRIPAQIKNIGDGTFAHCKALTNIIIPSTVQTIGEWAFAGCDSLKTINIPDSIQAIEDGTFSGCSTLAEITIPDTVKSIGARAFSNCSDLKSITLPKDLDKIEDGTFSQGGLESIDMPDGIQSIGHRAFEHCPLTTANMPSSLISIDDYAFLGCSLQTLIMPTGLKSIGAFAFEFCQQLTSIEFTLPSTLETIGKYAFYANSSLKTITIPSSVSLIGDMAFFDSYKLETVHFSGATAPTLTHKGEQSIFLRCESLETVTKPSVATNYPLCFDTGYQPASSDKVCFEVTTPLTYLISANPTSCNFGQASVGYEPLSPQIITIENIGTGPVELSQPLLENYILTPLMSPTSLQSPEPLSPLPTQTVLQPTETASFTLNPLDDLGINTYNSTLTVIGNKNTTNEVTLSIPLTFEVVAASPLLHNLTVTGGTPATGSYEAGTEVTIDATVPVGQQFVKWVGDTTALNDVNLPSAILTMPASNVALVAEYTTLPNIETPDNDTPTKTSAKETTITPPPVVVQIPPPVDPPAVIVDKPGPITGEIKGASTVDIETRILNTIFILTLLLSAGFVTMQLLTLLHPNFMVMCKNKILPTGKKS